MTSAEEKSFTTLTVVNLNEVHCTFTKENVDFVFFQVIARIVDGSKFDEFKTMYGETLVTGEPDQ